MRRRLVLAVLSAPVLSAVAVSTSPARAGTSATRCSRGFDSTRNNPSMAVFDIEVLNISCQTAYRDIRNFPGRLSAKTKYRGYTCTYKFSGGDGFHFVCIDGTRGYAFDAGGD